MSTGTIKICCDFFDKRSYEEPWQRFVMFNGPEDVYTLHPKLQKTTLAECVPGDNVFFMLYLSPRESHMFFMSKDESFFQRLRDLDAKILLNHEGFNLFTYGDNIFNHPFALDVREHLYWKIKNFLESKGIPERRLYFIHSAQGYLDEIKKMQTTKIQWFDAPYHVKSKHLQCNLFLPWMNTVKVQAENPGFDYKYSALFGGRPTQFRYDILKSLYHKGLLSYGKNSMKQYAGGDAEFDSQLPIVYDGTIDKWWDKDYNETNVFKDIFLWVVGETFVPNGYPNFSEKTARAILYERPFVIFGHPGTLKYLHELGFKTFSDFWDESYDSEPDQNKRISMIVDIVSNICKHPNLNQLYKDMQSVIQHNKQKATETDYVQEVYEFLNDSLTCRPHYWNGQ